MLTGPDRSAAPARRRSRALRTGTSILAAFAFLAATMAVLVAGAHSADAIGPRSAGHSVGTHQLIGHQPGHVRVTASDRTDAPQHRVLPWTPVSVSPETTELTRPAETSELRPRPLLAWQPRHSTPAQGRSPPR